MKILRFDSDESLISAMRKPLEKYISGDIDKAIKEVLSSLTFYSRIALPERQITEAKEWIRAIAGVRDINEINTSYVFVFSRRILAEYLHNNALSLNEIGRIINKKHPDVKYLIDTYEGLLRFNKFKMMHDKFYSDERFCYTPFI